MEALKLELAEASRPMQGQSVSGDACCAVYCSQGVILAAVDALGHGPFAAAAAAEALQAVKEGAEKPLAELMQHCHERLKKTRGVAMSLALCHESGHSLSWTGVGNVEGLFLRSIAQGAGPARERLLLRGGVVGYQLPPQRVVSLALHPGDALIFATDGIRREFSEAAAWRGHSPQEMADSILKEFDAGTDDALVWVARFAGS